MNRLAYYRKHARMTQEELGEKLGLPKSNISAWEHSKRAIPVKHYAVIQKVLGLSDEEMLNVVSDSVFLPLDAVESFRTGLMRAIIALDIDAAAKDAVLQVVNTYTEEDHHE